MRWNLLVVQRQYDLDQTRHSGCGFEVSYIGLHRTDGQRLVLRPPRAQDGPQGSHLDRIAQRRPGTVGLYIAHLRGLHPGIGESLANDSLLRLLIGHRKATAVTVMVYRRSHDKGQDVITVCHRIGEALEDYYPAPLAADITVSCGIKGLASTVGRHHPCFRRGDRPLR